MTNHDPDRLRRLLDEVIEHEFSGKTDLLPAILENVTAQNAAKRRAPQRVSHQTAPRKPRRPMISWAMLGTVCALLVTVVISGFTSRTVTAAEIVSRLEESTATPSSFGLQSFHGRLIETEQIGAETTIIRETELWFLGSNRFQMVSTIRMADALTRTEVMLVEDTTLWIYDPVKKRGTFEPIAPLTGSINPFQMQSIDEFIDQMQGSNPSGHTIEIIGRESILGRDTYVLEVQTQDGLGSRMRMWVDSEFYLPLRQESSSAARPDHVQRSGFTRFEANIPIDSAIMNRPSDIVFERKQHPRLWDSVSAPFPLFEPAFRYVTDAGHELTTSVESHLDAQPPMMIADYFAQGETQQHGGQLSAELQHLFRMTISPTDEAAGCNSDEQAMGGVVVQLADMQGCSYTNPDPQVGETVSIIRDGVRIVLTADQWSITPKAELLAIAASLKPVSQ